MAAVKWPKRQQKARSKEPRRQGVKEARRQGDKKARSQEPGARSPGDGAC